LAQIYVKCFTHIKKTIISLYVLRFGLAFYIMVEEDAGLFHEHAGQ